MEKNKIEELKKIGIYIDEINNNPIIKKYKLSIKNSTIKKIDFEKLQTTIKIIEIKNSEISNIHFAKENNIKIIFLDCIFKNQLAVRDLSFKEKIKIIHCIFENMIDFSRITFYKIANFSCSRFKSEIRFTQVNFLAQSNFQEVYFKSECYFSKVEFKGRVSFFIARFRGEARFIQTKFLAEADIKNIEVENNFKEAHFENKCYFSEVEFKGKVSFAVSRFKGETLFANISSINNILEFNQVEFNRVKFVNTAERLNSYYFLNSTFKSITNFENLNINDLIFYNVVFENIVTFDKVNFNNKPNFENCTFSNQFNIEHKYIEYNFQDLQNRTNNITDKYKALLDARDLFRKLKSNRIAHHNLIDASELRAQELYTRELELKYKENKSLKEKIEQWQLFFYRKLCDHHTNILQSLNSLILVIGVFGIFGVAMVVGFNYSLGYEPILEHWYFSLDFYNHHINSTIQDNYLFMIVVNLIMLFAYLILVGFALCLKYMREFFIIISYGVTLLVLVVSPKILIPAIGIFTDKRVMLDPLSVLGGIYTIIFGFVVYSFVKTIRKNSIVPS